MKKSTFSFSLNSFLLFCVLMCFINISGVAQNATTIPVHNATGEIILPQSTIDPSGYARYVLNHTNGVYSVFYNTTSSRWELQLCSGTCSVLSYGLNVPSGNNPPYGGDNWSDNLTYVGSATPFLVTSVSKYIIGTTYQVVSGICPSSYTYKIDYAVSSAFPNPNPFARVELSDASGNFDNPTVIGSGATATNNGPFKTVNINAFNAPPGSGYKIRLSTYYNMTLFSNEIPISVMSASDIATAPVISGESGSLCSGTAYSYTASEVPNATGYYWDVMYNSGFGNPQQATGVTITGQGTRQVQITLSPGSNANQIRVFASHPCGNTIARTYNVSLAQPIPPISSIIGESNPLAGSTNNYSFNFSTFYGGGASHTWAYSGTGVTFTNLGGNSVQAVFAADATSGNLSVTVANECQTVEPFIKPITILVPKATVQNGPWHEASTWADNEVPLITDMVRINHDVSTTTSAQCGSLTIAASGKLTINDYDFTVGESQWDGIAVTPCGKYSLLIEGTLQISGGTIRVGGTINKSNSGTFKMTAGLVQVKRGGCGGSDASSFPLVNLQVNEGDVTGGTIEILGNSASFKGISLGDFGIGSTIKIGRESSASFFAGNQSSLTYQTYLPITLNRVGNVEMYSLITSGANLRPMLLSGGSLDLVRINGNLTIKTSNANTRILVGDEDNFNTPSTMGLSLKGNLMLSQTAPYTNILEMASGRVMFFGGEGSYSPSNGRPHCLTYSNVSQSIAITGTITGMTCNCNTPGLVLATAINIPRFTLDGKVILGNYDFSTDYLQIPSGTSGYFVTSGTGKLKLKFGSYPLGSFYTNIFPVGTETSFSPVRITYPSQTANAEVSVSVKNSFSNAVPTSKNVGLEWNISSNSTTPASVTFNWSEADESAGFDRSNLAVSRFSGAAWEVMSAGLSATGSGPYSVMISNVTQFSPWAIFDSQGALPVTLSSFNARSEGSVAQLEWETTSETNSERFEIQHSTDAKRWLNVGSVMSEGESRLLKRYHYTHTNPAKGENLYRLKMIDKDQTFTYSRVRSSFFYNTSGSQAFVFPNPVAERLYFNMNEIKQIRKIIIYNSWGTEVMKTSSITENGLYVKHLPAGVYTARIVRDNDSESSFKLIVMR